MSREAPVRFREGLGVKFPRATRRNIYVRSRRAGERVMASVCRFLTSRLQLKVNESKSAVARSGWCLRVAEQGKSLVCMIVTDLSPAPFDRRRIREASPCQEDLSRFCCQNERAPTTASGGSAT